MAKRKAKQTRRASVVPGQPSSSGGGLPSINYVMNGDRVNELFDQIVRVVLPRTSIFNREGTLVSVCHDRGVQTLTPQSLNGLLSSIMEIHCLSRTFCGDIRSRGYRLLRSDQAAAFVQSPRIVSQFPKLGHYTRSPQFDRDWNLIGTPGYHPASGIYYAGPQIECARGTQLLDRVLSEFCWKSPVDRVNFIGMLVTGVTMPHWPGEHPLLVCNSNQPGLGKTLLAKLLSLCLHGSCHTVSYNPNDEEFEKQLATRVEAGDPVIIVDNAKRHLRFRDDSIVVDSAVLERSITDLVLNFRRLGSTTSIRRPNDVIFAITMNDAKLGPDIRRRSNPVCLEFHGVVRTRVFSVAGLDQFVLVHRFEILAEILGLVDRWIQEGYPVPARPAQHPISQRWAGTIDAILRFAGLVDFLGNFDASAQAFDVDYDAVREICKACRDEPRASASVWAKRLREADLLTDRLFIEPGLAKREQSQATIVGGLLQKFIGVILDVPAGKFRLVSTPKTKSHVSVEYWFEPVVDARSAPPVPEATEQVGAWEPQEPIS
jgi:hypothetical protein